MAGNRLTNTEHDMIDTFVRHLLNSYKSDRITVEDVVSHIGHIISAVDIDNVGEVSTYILAVTTELI